MDENVLLKKWQGPVGGVPAFDRVNLDDFIPAWEDAAAAYRGEIASIVNDPAAPTFANVMVPLEESGVRLSRFEAYFVVWQSTLKDARVRQIEVELEPRRAALADELVQNAALFAKVEAVRETSGDRLTAVQKRLVDVRHRAFVLRGARLAPERKRRVAEINVRLASLGTQFDHNVMRDEQRPALVVDDAESLDGLPNSFVEAAAAEAKRRGLDGKFVVANTRSSCEPFLTFARRRDLRQRVHAAWTARGSVDNPAIIRETLALRAERAALFGFESFAQWKLSNKMLTDPRRALDFMMAVWHPALAQAKRDIADLQRTIDREGGDFELAPWDHRFYAERVRRERYDLDPELVRPYMRFERVRDAMFSVAQRLYALTFTPIDVPVYHPDVRAYEVRSETSEVGAFYLDPFARPGKSSGAWMGCFRPQGYTQHARRSPIVTNCTNFIKGGEGKPVWLSWDDARTLFHEFGHGLHGLLSDVKYPYLQGTAVATDYVEFPSHFHENFLRTEEVLSQLVDDDGRSMPRELIDKIKASEKFNQAFATVEFLGGALIDMRLHAAPPPADVPAAADGILREIGMPAEIALRHALPHFSHAFSHDHYAAGYYSYLWSDVMACDGFEAFTETGNAYDPTVAARLRQHVLSAGNSVDPAEGYRRFRGRDPDVTALLRSRGLAAGE